MDIKEYAQHDAVGLRELIRTGAVSAAEVEAVAREALERADQVVHGLAHPLLVPGVTGTADGPFTGVPFLIKDVPMAQGVPFSVGSRALQGLRAAYDTDLMRRFRAAGLVTLGVTAMPEMGLSFSTEPVGREPTRNPWHLDRGVGGSSGGAAALVAAGAVPMAHGNDGAGSIRIPASCCGLVGLKPSRGRTPCGPDVGEPAFGMLSDFALTRTVRDAAHLLDAVEGPGVGDKYTAPPPVRRYAEELVGGEAAAGQAAAARGALRVAVTTTPWSGVGVDASVASATVRTGTALAELGHHVTEASPAIDWTIVRTAVRAETAANAAPFLMAPRRPHPTKLEAVSRQVMAEVERMSALDLMIGFDAQNRVSRTIGVFFTEYDLLVTPTLGQLPAPHGTLRYDSQEYTLDGWLDRLFEYGPFTVVFNISGHPAISLPLGQSADGLPIGVQLVAAYGREDVLFRASAQLERAMPWSGRTPAMFPG